MDPDFLAIVAQGYQGSCANTLESARMHFYTPTVAAGGGGSDDPRADHTAPHRLRAAG